MIFLSGTVGKNNWRENFTTKLTAGGISPDYIFNPVVPAETWNERAKRCQRATILLYYLGLSYHDQNTSSPYSIIEIMTSLLDDEKRTIAVTDTKAVTGHSLKILTHFRDILRYRFPDAVVLDSLDKALAKILDQLVKAT